MAALLSVSAATATGLAPANVEREFASALALAAGGNVYRPQNPFASSARRPLGWVGSLTGIRGSYD